MLSIEYRDYTDVGFKTTFALVSDQTPALSEGFDSQQANVYADHPHTPAGAGVSLQTEKGSIKSLNGYVFGGKWPTGESEFRVLQLNYSLTNLKAETV